jgi:UDP-2-acetamido-3-amino-2,3-dideoxy-glucuronate N-acetyltransferase
MSSDFFIHQSAIADAGSQIGKGTRIWHFCHLMPGSVVGTNCNIGQNVFIDNDVVVGNGVKIQNNVSVYKGVVIEDGAFLGPSMVFTNVINPRSFIERKDEFKSTIVRKGATIGANATIVCGVEIGAYSLIGAGSVITKPVPAYALMVGNPARQIGWVSEQGHRLHFGEDNKAWCEAEQQGYALLNGAIHKS